LINHKENIQIKNKKRQTKTKNSYCYFLLQTTFAPMDNDLSSEEDVHSLNGNTKKYL